MSTLKRVTSKAKENVKTESESLMAHIGVKLVPSLNFPVTEQMKSTILLKVENYFYPMQLEIYCGSCKYSD